MTHQDEPDGPSGNAVNWSLVPSNFRTGSDPLPPPWEDRFGPLRRGTVDDLVVVGQIGQSIDGRIATVTGHSKYINGPAGLTTSIGCAPWLTPCWSALGRRSPTTRSSLYGAWPALSPARVVLDPRGRLSPEAQVLADDGVRRLVLPPKVCRPHFGPGVEVVEVPAVGGEIAPAAILAALAERGFRRILIEGGAHTVSRFIAAGCLDRLHVMVAPIIIGAGQTGVTLKLRSRAPTRRYARRCGRT